MESTQLTLPAALSISRPPLLPRNASVLYKNI
jgi:hypothetical protein